MGIESNNVRFSIRDMILAGQGALIIVIFGWLVTLGSYKEKVDELKYNQQQVILPAMSDMRGITTRLEMLETEVHELRAEDIKLRDKLDAILKSIERRK